MPALSRRAGTPSAAIEEHRVPQVQVMMGYGHATMASAVWLGVTAPTLISVPLVPTDTKTMIIAGMVIAAGSGLLPDLDHPEATVSGSLPPLTNVASRGIAAISGGHRKGTHSLITAIALAMMMFSLLPVTWVIDVGDKPFNLLAATFVLFLGSMASQALHLSIGELGSWPTALILAALAGFLVPPGGIWLPAAFIIGYLIHIVGDLLTTQGVPVFYPISTVSVRLPLLGNAGSFRENVLVGLMTTYISAVLALLVIAPAPPWV